MMSGQLILSGEPYNTFSMARLKILQLCLTLTQKGGGGSGHETQKIKKSKSRFTEIKICHF
jgi:phosphoserine aminotransferase